MTPQEFIENCLKTESKDFNVIKDRISSAWIIRLDHAADGLVTEAGEFKDILKKYKFYGKPLDNAHMLEELGDIFWYLGIVCNIMHISFEEIWERNIAKLKFRYGDKFSEEDAINRALGEEREILEFLGKCEHTYIYEGFCTSCGKDMNA